MTSSAPSPDPVPNASLTGPRSLLDLFTTFTLLALQGFGGVLAVAHRMLVERKRWIARDEFVEMLSLSQLLPGANVVNLALMLGDRYFGWRGALAALAGMLCVPLVVVMGLAVLYVTYSDHAVVAGALRGMGAVAAGLTISMALKLSTSLRRNPMGLIGCIALGGATVLGIAVLRLPLYWVVPVLGVIGWCVARLCIKRTESDHA